MNRAVARPLVSASAASLICSSLHLFGDGLYYIIRWMPSGEQRLLGTHQYGNDMTNADSPHYLDQAEDYANEVLHEPLYTKESRQGRIERRYTVSSTL
ncbi:hypothetical protein N9N10_02425 [Luminiphilus sp.]|nr:hypothetical protein [Luminiphilus sp.]